MSYNNIKRSKSYTHSDNALSDQIEQMKEKRSLSRGKFGSLDLLIERQEEEIKTPRKHRRKFSIDLKKIRRSPSRKQSIDSPHFVSSDEELSPKDSPKKSSRKSPRKSNSPRSHSPCSRSPRSPRSPHSPKSPSLLRLLSKSKIIKEIDPSLNGIKEFDKIRNEILHSKTYIDIETKQERKFSKILLVLHQDKKRGNKCWISPFNNGEFPHNKEPLFMNKEGTRLCGGYIFNKLTLCQDDVFELVNNGYIEQFFNGGKEENYIIDIESFISGKFLKKDFYLEDYELVTEQEQVINY